MTHRTSLANRSVVDVEGSWGMYLRTETPFEGAWIWSDRLKKRSMFAVPVTIDRKHTRISPSSPHIDRKATMVGD